MLELQLTQTRTTTCNVITPVNIDKTTTCNVRAPVNIDKDHNM